MFARRRDSDFFYWLTMGGIVLIAVILVATFVKDCKDRRTCTQHGGVIVETNCRVLTNCHTTSSGRTSCTTSNACDWRCDTNPEAEQP